MIQLAHIVEVDWKAWRHAEEEASDANDAFLESPDAEHHQAAVEARARLARATAELQYSKVGVVVARGGRTVAWEREAGMMVHGSNAEVYLEHHQAAYTACLRPVYATTALAIKQIALRSHPLDPYTLCHCPVPSPLQAEAYSAYRVLAPFVHYHSAYAARALDAYMGLDTPVSSTYGRAVSCALQQMYSCTRLGHHQDD